MKLKNKIQYIKKQNPTGGLGFIDFKESSNKDLLYSKNTNPIYINVQGICTQCEYFHLVKLTTGKIRKICQFSGERLNNMAIVNGCEFRHVVEVTDV